MILPVEGGKSPTQNSERNWFYKARAPTGSLRARRLIDAMVEREANMIGHTRRSRTMKIRIWPAIGAGALLSLSAVAQTAPELTLTRIQCGTARKPPTVAPPLTHTVAPT